MPRTLPWVGKNGGIGKKSPVQQKSVVSTPQRQHAKDVVNERVSDINTSISSSNLPKQNEQTEVFTPPPSSELSAKAPQVEYMREGPDEDDGWMMVEDEFLATARLFTKHVHHAAYADWQARHSNIQRSLQTEMLERPTDKKTQQSNMTKLKMHARMTIPLEHGSSGGMRDSDDDDEDSSTHPLLAGLFNGSQRRTQDIAALPRCRPKTRAAAGYLHSPRKPKADKPDDPQRNDPIKDLVSRDRERASSSDLTDADDSEDLDRNNVLQRSSNGVMSIDPIDKGNQQSPKAEHAAIIQDAMGKRARTISRQDLDPDQFAQRQARLAKHKNRKLPTESRAEEVPTWLV